MTYEEMKILARGGTVEPGVIAVPKQPNSFCPPAVNKFNEGVPLSPDTKDFNNISIVDMEFLSQSKHMDSLHRIDALAENYKYGANLNALHKSLGKDKFKEFLKVKHEKK